MKRIFAFMLLSVSVGAAGQQITQELKPFNKIIIDPYINVELVKGEKEKIEIYYDGIEGEEIITQRKGKTLHLFLADSKIGLRFLKDNNYIEKKYKNAEVKMVITYRELKNIQFRGEEKLTCNDELASKKLKIKVYGETDVSIALVNSKKLKIALFGENDFEILDGNTHSQVINTYGDNSFDTSNLKSYIVSSNSFGENAVSVNASDYIKLMHFGEGLISYSGHPNVERRWIIGDVDIRNNK